MAHHTGAADPAALRDTAHPLIRPMPDAGIIDPAPPAARVPTSAYPS